MLKEVPRYRRRWYAPWSRKQQPSMLGPCGGSRTLRGLLERLECDAGLFMLLERVLLPGTLGQFTLLSQTDTKFVLAEIAVDRQQIVRNGRSLAVTIGHEAAHAVYALDHPAEIAALQSLLDERDQAMRLRPQPSYLPDLLRLSMERTRETETFARAAEADIAAELGAVHT